MILDAAETYEVIESYPEDKYLPSYLVWGKYGDNVFHALIATDTLRWNVRLVTAYWPNDLEWEPGFRRRKAS